MDGLPTHILSQIYGFRNRFQHRERLEKVLEGIRTQPNPRFETYLTLEGDQMVYTWRGWEGKFASIHVEFANEFIRKNTGN